MGKKKPTSGSGSGSGSIGDIMEAVAPRKGEGEGSAAAPAAPGSSKMDGKAARAQPMVVPRKADRTPVEDLIYKRLRAIRKKKTEAEMKNPESLPILEMVEKELDKIWCSLPDALEEEKKLLLSVPKEEGERSIPKEGDAPKEEEKASEEASGVNPKEEVAEGKASEEASGVNPKEEVAEGKASEEASGMNPIDKPSGTDPVPPAEEEKWFIKHGKRQYSEVMMTGSDENIEKYFQDFLAGFECRPGDKEPYYHSQLAAIADGLGPSVLHVSYRHICQFSRNLAMRICASYKRLRRKLNTAASKYMEESFSVKLEKKLTVKLLGVPMRHQLFQQFLHCPLQDMKVFGQKNVKKPTPEFCSKLQGLLWYLMRKHMKGLSWNGDFDIGNIEVFNGNTIVITKAPQQFRREAELIKASENDFLTVAKKILVKLYSRGCIVPLLPEYDAMLSNMGRYATFWSDYRLADNIRDFIGHHPFLKPPLAVANLFAGIHSSSRSYDKRDEKVAFQKTMQMKNGFKGWTEQVLLSANSLLVKQLTFKEKTQAKAGKVGPHSVKDTVVDSEDYDVLLKPPPKYADDLQSFVEYIRHLFNHGTDHTKEKRTFIIKADGSLYDPNPKPREQYMASIEEAQVAASINLGSYVQNVLHTFVTEDSFKGMIGPFWDLYKNSSFRTPDAIGDTEMDQWFLMTLDDDEQEWEAES